MDDLITTLSSFPPDKSHSPSEYDKAAVAHVKELTGIPQSAWTKSTSSTNVLDKVDPAINSIAYLFALSHYITTAGDENREQVLQYIIRFFENYEANQIRHIATKWREVYDWTAQALIADQQRDVTFLGHALLRLDSTPAFTICHVTFLRLCLRASVPSQACLVLDKDIHQFPRLSNKSSAPDALSSSDDATATSNGRSGIVTRLTSEHVLEYYLLGAIVYIGMSNWQKARLFLEFVILHPSINHIASTLQIDAYKKWILIGLLTEGSPFPQLRTVDQGVLKNVRAVSRPYDVLAATFESRNWRKLHAEVDVGMQIWTEDGNARLVQAVADGIMTHCVSDLQKTYAALPVSTVAEHLSLPIEQTYGLLQRMIEQGRLKASLTPVNSTTLSSAALQFHSRAHNETLRQPHDIEAQTGRIEALVRAIQDADCRSRLTKEYLEVLRRSKRQHADDDPADQMDLEWTSTQAPAQILADDGDEDIMA